MATHLPSTTSFTALAQDVLQRAKKLGATAAETDLHVEEGLSTTVRLGEVETVEYHRDKSLHVTVYVGQQKGSASSSDLSDAAIQDTVQAAYDIANTTQADAYAGLADAKRLAKHLPDLDLYHPWSINTDDAITLAKQCETLARAQDKRIVNSEGATVNSHDGLSVYANSHGFCGAYNSSRHTVSCVLVAKDDKGMQRDYAYTVARDPRELWAIERVADEAAQRTVRRLNAQHLSTMQVPVLFAAEIAGSLLSHFIGAIRGGNLYRGTSFLVDSLGKNIFPEWVHIHEAPHLPRALGSAPFDGEGVETVAQDFIRDGILQQYVLGSYSARKLGLETTGNAGGVHNLMITPTGATLDNPEGQHDLPALLKMMGRGVLVTEVMGQGVNLTTGNYSRGAAGFWVENGEIQYPVEEFTIAGNLKEMYANLVAVGNDIDLRGNIRSGSILLENMTIAGA